MQIKKEISDVVRSKFKTPIILAIALVCILIFPTVILENADIPTSNENLFYLGELSDAGTFNAINNTTSQFSWNFVLLNHRSEPLVNTTIFGSSNIIVKEQSTLQICNEVIPVTSKTNSFGMANFTIAYLISVTALYTGLSNFTILNFNLINYSVSKAAWEGKASPKYDLFSFSSSSLQNRYGNVTKVYFSTISSNLLGYYGLTPVIMACGNPNTAQPVNISYKLYNPQNAGKNYTTVNLTKLKNYQIYTIQNYTILKEFNEANNVTFYGTGNVRIGSLFLNSQSFFFTRGTSIITIFPAAEIALLVALLMVLIIYTPMFNNNVYKRYLSLPEQRRRTILVQISSSLITSSIFTGIALGASYILAYVFLGFLLAPIAILFTFVIIESAFFVFESIYTVLSAYFPGRGGVRTFMTVFLVFGYPLISEIASSLVAISSLGFFSNVVNYTYLFKPVLEKMRTYNILTSILPVLNIEQFNNYLLREPFSGVVMYNHLNIFDLSPIIFLSSIIGFSALFIYLGIRKFEKI